MAGQETAEVFLTLIKLDHVDWDVPLYLVDNGEDIAHSSVVYQAFPFECRLPDDEDEGIPVLRWTAANVGREIIQKLRGLTGAVSATCSWIIASEPDTVQRGPFDVELKAVEYNALEISGVFGLDPILEEPFGHLTMTPSTTPALF